MKTTILKWFFEFLKDPKYQQIRGVFLFIAITLTIHYIYRFWAMGLHFYPIHIWMESFRDFMAKMVYEQSTWVNCHIFGLNLEKEGMTMFFLNGSAITIDGGCSGDKQILQLALLLLIYPGRWRYKIWFIPLGIIIVHATNVLRIVLLSVVTIWRFEWMDIAHDLVLRGIFYVVIFGIWMLFVKLSGRRRKMRKSNNFSSTKS